MYKLVIVGGQKRGEEFELSAGENIVGRADHCKVKIDELGVSKEHFKIIVNANSVYLEDLKSSNGTMINDKVTFKTSLNHKDIISIPETIFEFVEVKEKKVFVLRDDIPVQDDDDKEIIPVDNWEKFLFFVRKKVMGPIYKINQEYEWSVLFAIFLSIFIAINIAIAVLPILQDHKDVLLREITRRAAHYADDISRMNASALERRDLDEINTNFLKNEEGVESYELFDDDGRIVRPQSRMNQNINDTFSVDARDWARNKKYRFQQNYIRVLGSGVIGIAKRVMVNNPRIGSDELVGIIAIKFRPESWSQVAKSNSIVYFRALIISALVGIIFFSIIYYLTFTPINNLNKAIDKYLRGKASEEDLKDKMLFNFLTPLRKNIKSMIQKISEYESSDGLGMFQDADDDTSYLEILKNIVPTHTGPCLVLNAMKEVMYLNSEAEDLTGIRESASSGGHILDVAKEKGFSSTLIELCDESTNLEGKCAEGEYEILGRNYLITVSSVIGKDSFAKGHMITFRVGAV